jgi:molybdopterin-synthase adenylyltransferase
VLPHPRRRGAGADTDATRQAAHAPKVIWNAEQATPCLRCVFPEAPPPGTTPTCDTAGVLGSAVAMIAAHQVAQAIKLLTGNLAAVDRSLMSIDVWSNEFRRFDVSAALSESCPCCGLGRFEFLEGSSSGATTSLCGRSAVQVSPATSSSGDGRLDLAQIAGRLAPHGEFTHNKFLLRGEFRAERGDNGAAIELTLFPNGRAIIKGTTEPDKARTIYAKYVGA